MKLITIYNFSSDCFEEFTSERGHILSKNYPNYIGGSADCIYEITPPGSSSTNYKLQFDEFVGIWNPSYRKFEVSLNIVM